MSERPNEREHRISTDRETIRRWADETNAVPARHAEAQGESQRLLLVQESEVGESHDRLEWDEFFTAMEEHDQVLIYRETAEREPFEVLARDEAVTKSAVDQEQLEAALVEGETVTSEVTETTVVESVIVEEATIESELVDTEIIDQQVIDVELVNRECTGCELVADRTGDNAMLFDETRYFDSLDTGDRSGGEEAGVPSTGSEGEGDFPYHAELDVLETWSVTREVLEQFTVESRITETAVSGNESVEDQDIDFEGVHRNILESDLLGGDLSPDEILTEHDVESEFTEGDTIHSYFKRRRVIDEEVADEKRLHADITGGETLTMEAVSSTDVETEFTDDEGLTPLDSAPPDADQPAETTAGAEGPTEETTTSTEHPTEETTAGTERTGVDLTDDEIGKTVVDDTGEEVGMVTDVADSGHRLYVDPDPSITERLKAELDWGDTKEDDYPIGEEKIQRITDDRVKLKG